jgi:carbonic anhydrase/acetyltransferase-like protein (isoleucine patch superfamily)
VVTEGKSFPDRVLILGVPAKVVRELSDDDVARLRLSALGYVEKAQRHRATLRRIV